MFRPCCSSPVRHDDTKIAIDLKITKYCSRSACFSATDSNMYWFSIYLQSNVLESARKPDIWVIGALPYMQLDRSSEASQSSQRKGVNHKIESSRPSMSLPSPKRYDSPAYVAQPTVRPLMWW